MSSSTDSFIGTLCLEKIKFFCPSGLCLELLTVDVCYRRSLGHLLSLYEPRMKSETGDIVLLFVFLLHLLSPIHLTILWSCEGSTSKNILALTV